MKKSFTLTEALVSIAILGLVSISLLPAIYNGIRMTNKSEDRLDELFYCQKVVEEYKASYFTGQALAHQGEDYEIRERDLGSTLEVDFIFHNLDEDYQMSIILPKNLDLYQ